MFFMMKLQVHQLSLQKQKLSKESNIRVSGFVADDILCNINKWNEEE